VDRLRRLRSGDRRDCIDLVQHHEILRYEDPNRIFAEDGANAALLEAKQAGKLRYIGFTGHKDPHIHLYMLEVAKQNEFHFDAVQLPLNVIDAHCRSFAKLVLPELVKEEIGVLAMKTMANGSIVHSKTVTPIEALHYALNLPVSVVIAGMENMEILDQAFEAVRTFKPLSAEELAALLDKTRHAAARGEFEPFKTSSIYDATALTPSFLGDEPERLQALVP
jgi:aryl-alcohol dehydrogenase-like predicted oxidoreductase